MLNILILPIYLVTLKGIPVFNEKFALKIKFIINIPAYHKGKISLDF